MVTIVQTPLHNSPLKRVDEIFALSSCMKLIIIRENKDTSIGEGRNLLEFALSSEPIASLVLDGLTTGLSLSRNRARIWWPFVRLHSNDVVFAIPQDWDINTSLFASKIVRYDGGVLMGRQFVQEAKRNKWLDICNGQFVTKLSNRLLAKVLEDAEVDVVAVDAKPELLAYREKVRLTTRNSVAGFRRLHSNSVELRHISSDWPHHLFIRTNILNLILNDQPLGRDFLAFIEKCQSHTLKVRSVNVAGVALDLETERGLLSFCRMMIGYSSLLCNRGRIARSSSSAGLQSRISPDSRFVGEVLLGKNVQVGPKVTVLGPTIIGNNAVIEKGVAIDSSIIGSHVVIPANQFLQHRIVIAPSSGKNHVYRSIDDSSKRAYSMEFQPEHRDQMANVFRTWPRFSYVRCFKRVADFIAATIVLMLFVPVMPFIALAIKLSSPGPVFFKDRRQGRHGKEFSCLKFRTMTVGADEIQEKLRTVSEVDGPQFKMADDPRINAIGRFLRETYIDEIPQFFNVLLGQMSLVGPRPSPEQENTLCPFWRDARLSVRPGITGFWQVRRTRQPMKDFQEWIHYDLMYIRGLSLRMDMWICWQTIKKMVDKFIEQF